MLINKIKRIDYLLVFVILFLSCFGIMMVFSASYPIAEILYEDSNYFFTKQLQWFLIGLFLLTLAAVVPYNFFGKISPLLVILSIFLLILVLMPGIGVERNNSQRWIQIGSFVYQPTEVVKLFMIIYFAYFYSKKQQLIVDFKKGVLPPLILLIIVFLLILKQPDLGSAALLLVTCGIVVFSSGVRRIHLFIMGSIGVIGISYFAFTTEYRLQRLTSYLNAFDDPAGHGYQLVNSYIAIGSGGIWGNGIGNSVQKLGYLPEAHTDFIMSIIIEELGLLGLAVVVGSYLFIMFRGVRIAKQCKDMFPKLLAIGITFQIMTQAVLNLGAVSGLLPITGITLPFISYGGSSLVITMICAGILVNLSANRTESLIVKN
ncbi:putative lipid II flippase FtsW [Oceanobacillus damuensis]|uniref:putative lipid II flippase FtsW n=1 Tax=Oceanobacillus damuensis TaxID=937928 RepID=UPI00082E9D15|nr:putative lipid II flippase FtsW [Oceanobacillus damuensis]